MKKLLYGLLIPVICLCLVACNNSDLDSNGPANLQDDTSTTKTDAQAYVGVWKTSDIAFNLDGDTWTEDLVITLNEDGTATYRGENATWEYNDKYGKYGNIHLTRSSGGKVVLNIDQESGKTVLRYNFDSFYYRESDFAEVTQ